MMDIKESGKGKGSFIINEILAAFKKEGYKKARLAYMKGNSQSRRFWEKCGFAETGIEKYCDDILTNYKLEVVEAEYEYFRNEFE